MMTLIDSAIYVDGARISTPSDLSNTYRSLDHSEYGMAWIGLLRPTDAELESVAAEFNLHPLAVQDAREGHQRSKLERHGHTLFTVLRPAWYDEKHETVQFGEVHLFTGDDFVVTVRHADKPDLREVRARLERTPEILSAESESVLVAVVAEVVDGYLPVTAGLRADIDEVEDELFTGAATADSSRRIYKLLSEVISFERAISPMPDMLDDLLAGADKYGTDEEVRSRLNSIRNDALRITERINGYRALLENALTLHSALVAQEQNDAMSRMTSASLAQGEESRRLAEAAIEQGEQVKRISSWAAILFAPTLIAGIYGMNFRHMPELGWALGYPFALSLMAGLAVMLWVVFRHKKWI